MTLSESAIREHYRRAKPVYEALATVSDYPTIGLNDFVGWYIKRDHDDIEAIKTGYPQRGRVAHLDRDYDEIHNRLERTLYVVTTYKSPTAFQRWEPCRYDESEETTVWQDEPPTPGYRDLRAVPAWGDIDLADDIKPQRGDLDAQTRELVERILDAYIDEYATLYGTRDAVYALDSVGGAYVFGAPEATLPIADHFSDDPDALERVFDAFLNRSNSWLQEAETRVNERIDGAGDVIQPDWVNNKNRQYKPPLSIHADHDAVVTPIATGDVRYELRPFETVDDTLIEQAVSWADDLTRVEHTDCVDSLVATLWPDLYEEHDGWQATVEAWVDAERERERERQQRREAALQRRQERLEELDGALEGRPITPFKEDVYEAVENVDITEIARHYASDAYDTDPNQPRPQFDPCWRHSESGQSCFVDEQVNTFGDSKVNAGGGPAKLMALATGIVSEVDADLDGEAYWAAVDELRTTGYDIPVWIPEADSDRVDGGTYDQMPFWAIRKAAVALEVCPENAFVDREGEDGTYEGFPGYETYNETLEAIEALGLKHGRERVTPDENTADDESESPAAASASDESAGDLDRAHLREKNRLLTAKVERLESELEEKSEQIEDLEAEVSRLCTELATLRSERDRLGAAIEEREFEQESNQRGRDEDQSPLDRAKRFVSFGE
jgi:putative DNA primase/helicase